MAFKVLALAAAVVLPVSAHAAVTVLGNSKARQCYEAALLERSTPSNIRICNEALSEGMLVGRDRTATHVNRGILHIRNGDFGAGLADYDRALEINAEEPEAYLNKGLAILRRDRSGAEVVDLFDAALEHGTSEPAVAYYARAVAHELNGDIPAAYYDLRRAREADPNWDAPARELERFVVQE